MVLSIETTNPHKRGFIKLGTRSWSPKTDGKPSAIAGADEIAAIRLFSREVISGGERVIAFPSTRSPAVRNKSFASSWTLSAAPQIRSRVSFCRRRRSRYLVTRIKNPDPFVPSRGSK